MANTKINAASLGTLPPQKAPYRDEVVTGLCFQVGVHRRRWFYQFREGGKLKEATIGFYIHNAPAGSGSVGLAEARDKAREMKGRASVAAPVVVAPEKAVHPKSGKTIADIITGYVAYREAKAKGNDPKWKRGMKTLPEAEATVRRVLKDYLDLPVKAFTKADLRRVRDDLAATAPSMSDRFLAYLNPFMKWAATEDIIDHNFVGDVLKVGPGVVKRDRVLSDAELKAIWRACGQFNSPEALNYGRLVRFLMVTAQRREEGATVKHGDFIGGHWKQEEDSNKSGREHLLKLPQLAVEVLGSGKAHELCFPGKREGRPLSGFSKLKKQLDKLSGVTGWRHHDLRRTASTRLQEAGTPPHIIDAVLNHAIVGVGAHYMHATLNTQKGEAIEAWAAMLKKILRNTKQHLTTID